MSQPITGRRNNAVQAAEPRSGSASATSCSGDPIASSTGAIMINIRCSIMCIHSSTCPYGSIPLQVATTTTTSPPRNAAVRPSGQPGARQVPSRYAAATSPTAMSTPGRAWLWATSCPRPSGGRFTLPRSHARPVRFPPGSASGPVENYWSLSARVGAQ